MCTCTQMHTDSDRQVCEGGATRLAAQERLRDKGGWVVSCGRDRLHTWVHPHLRGSKRGGRCWSSVAAI